MKQKWFLRIGVLFLLIMLARLLLLGDKTPANIFLVVVAISGILAGVYQLIRK